MVLCQGLFEILSVRLRITHHLLVAFLKSLAGQSRRSQGIDAGAEIDDLRRINARSLSPGLRERALILRRSSISAPASIPWDRRLWPARLFKKATRRRCVILSLTERIS